MQPLDDAVGLRLDLDLRDRLDLPGRHHRPDHGVLFDGGKAGRIDRGRGGVHPRPGVQAAARNQRAQQEHPKARLVLALHRNLSDRRPERHVVPNAVLGRRDLGAGSSAIGQPRRPQRSGLLQRLRARRVTRVHPPGAMGRARRSRRRMAPAAAEAPTAAEAGQSPAEAAGAWAEPRRSRRRRACPPKPKAKAGVQSGPWSSGSRANWYPGRIGLPSSRQASRP